MKFTPEIDEVLAASFAGDELAQVRELWSKKKGQQMYIAEGKLLCSPAELIAKLSKKSAKSEKASTNNSVDKVKAELATLSITELKEVIAEAEKLIKANKEAEIAELEARLAELKAL